jgi:16S rRNA (guanine(966)-N(2))-methyltransferase RsmD
MGDVRIIGGRWKRTKLPVADKPGLRPTSSRVRETLFNWLGQDLTGWHCLDAFAGTGALGLEAASRGATRVLMVEKDGGLVRQLQELCVRLAASGVEVQRGDGLMALQRAVAGSLDLVLLDPPFDAPVVEPALAAAAQAIKAHGLVYLEAPRTWTDADLAAFGLCQHRAAKAGMVHFHLLRKAPAA